MSKGDNKFILIKNSYIYKLVSRIVSVLFSVTLVFLIILGGLMFYHNMQSKSYEKRGLIYTPPFGLYTIVSGSMMPNVNVYDVVIAVKKDPDSIKIGDVITYVSNWDLNYGLNITHRVVDIQKNELGEYSFITKGDNNNDVDKVPVPYQNVVGKVVMKIPQLGRLQFFLSTKFGWFLIVFFPALIVIIFDILKIKKLLLIKQEADYVKDVKDSKFAIKKLTSIVKLRKKENDNSNVQDKNFKKIKRPIKKR